MMKSNIDLTENQMFSREPVQLRGIVSTIFGMALPWTFRQLRIHCREFEAIRTGDRQEREAKKLCDKEVSRNYCDRCGVYLANIPWSRTYGLCQKCSDDLEKEFRTYPWEDKTPSRPNNELRSLNW